MLFNELLINNYKQDHTFDLVGYKKQEKCSYNKCFQHIWNNLICENFYF